MGGVSRELDQGCCSQGSDGLAQRRLWLQDEGVWEHCRETKEGKEDPKPSPRFPAWARWCGGAREGLGGHDEACLMQPASWTLCPFS